MKYLVLIPDGMADEQIEALGGLSPMQKANKPVMDELAKSALVGTVSNVPEGMVPESDTAILPFFPTIPRSFPRAVPRWKPSASASRCSPTRLPTVATW